MAKKKIAVFANGLNFENIMKYMKGIMEQCPDNFADFHIFLGHDSFGNSEEFNKAEWCIYNLPNLNDYDGAVIFGPGLNYEEVSQDIVNRCYKAGIPTICVSSKYENTVRIYTDNYEGMKLLSDHLIDVHGVKDILFIAGPKDNDESNDRLRAVQDSFADHGITIEDRNIFYSNWVMYLATDFVKARYLSEEGLPDAIICASDSIAYFICFVLEDLGVKCPEEIIVTGFDGNDQAMQLYPSITTVVQPFYEIGAQTTKCLIDIFNGIHVEREYCIPCSFRKAESCGCDTSDFYDEYRRKSSVKTYKNSILNDLHLYKIKCLTDEVLKSDSYTTVSQYLQNFFYASDGFEGNPFYICMDPNFGKLGEEDVVNLPQYKFGNTFYMLVGKNGDKKYEMERFDLSNGLIPKDTEDQVNHMYVFQPVYYKSFVCGYIIMADNIEHFGNAKYHFMHTHFNRLLDQYKKNMQLHYLNSKLSQLMNTDALTSTKNRMAFEIHKKILAEEIAKGANNIAFVVADINNLKTINDAFGHEFGDKYIKNASDFICKIFKHSPVFRIGGDEFLIVLTGQDFDNRFELTEKMGNEMLAIDKNETDPIKKVSIAFGFVDYDASKDTSIDDAIRRADKEMYANKRKYKKLLNLESASVSH